MKLEVEGDNSNLNHNPNSNSKKHSSSSPDNRKPLLTTFGQSMDTVLSNNPVEEGKSLKDPVVGYFVVDNRAFACSQICATFYPKFENSLDELKNSIMLEKEEPTFLGINNGCGKKNHCVELEIGRAHV